MSFKVKASSVTYRTTRALWRELLVTVSRFLKFPILNNFAENTFMRRSPRQRCDPWHSAGEYMREGRKKRKRKRKRKRTAGVGSDYSGHSGLVPCGCSAYSASAPIITALVIPKCPIVIVVVAQWSTNSLVGTVLQPAIIIAIMHRRGDRKAVCAACWALAPSCQSTRAPWRKRLVFVSRFLKFLIQNNFAEIIFMRRKPRHRRTTWPSVGGYMREGKKEVSTWERFRAGCAACWAPVLDCGSRRPAC